MTDRKEALRLADSIHEMNNAAYMTAIANLNEKNRQQAERIAELQSAHAVAVEIAAQYAAQRDQLRAEVERLRVEREHWHKSFEHVSRILSGIHALMYPEPFTLSDGRTVVFRPKDPGPHEILQALSDRIRAIPDEVAAIDHARTTHKDPA